MTAAVRFVKRYSVYTGAAFMRFERTSDGARVDVKVRRGRGELERYTRREARMVAEDRLAGSPATWRVVCDDYATEPATLAEAEGRLAGIIAGGLCGLPHVISNGDCEIAAGVR